MAMKGSQLSAKVIRLGGRALPAVGVGMEQA